jgi:hypothetical protein
MSHKGIQSKHVFSRDDRDYIKQNDLVDSNEKSITINNIKWCPIQFEWIPV